MADDSIMFKNSLLNKVIFASSIFVCAFWIVGQLFDVYQYALVGAIFEILWLPCILSLVGIPVISFILLIKEKFTIKSLNLYSIVMVIAGFIFIYMRNK